MRPIFGSLGKFGQICAIALGFCSLSEQTLYATPPQGSGLRINEIIAANDGGIRGPDGKRHDWIELINISAEPVNLADYYLSDSQTPPSKTSSYFRDLMIDPGEQVVIHAVGDKFVNEKLAEEDSVYHTSPFKIDADGEWLYLFHRNSGGESEWKLMESLHIPALDEDQAYGWGSDSRPGYLESPTPGFPNTHVTREWVSRKMIRISPESSYIEKDSELLCTASIPEFRSGSGSEKAWRPEIFYTIDGSDPSSSESRKIWPSDGIKVNRTSVIRVSLVHGESEVCAQQSRTYLFHGDLFKDTEGFEAPAGWPDNWGANYLYYGPSQNRIDKWNWQDDLKKAFTSIPTYSLVIDSGSLFDAENGIYANSPMKGRDWERRCLLEFLPVNPGEENFNVNAGVRIRGGFSRNSENPKHSLRFFFRGEYGDPKLKYPLFGIHGADEFDHLDLRCSQNYSWSFGRDASANFVRDQFNRDIQEAMGQPSARGDFCHLFINGLYWGLYNSSERPEASYGATYFGGKKKQYDVIKSAGFNWGGRYSRQADDRGTGPTGMTMHIEATDGNIDAWKDLWDLANSGNGFGSNENYLKAVGLNMDGRKDKKNAPLLDAGNLADYMLTILAMGNRDAPLTSRGDRPNNWYAMRNREGDEGFRFFIWDAEHSLISQYEDRTGPWKTGEIFEYSNPQYFWEQCLKNKDFRFLVKDRVAQHFSEGGPLTTLGQRRLFLMRAREIEQAVIAESARWGSRVSYDPEPYNILNRDQHWRPAIRRIYSEYFAERPSVVYGQLQSAGLTHQLPYPEIRKESDGDTVRHILTIPENLGNTVEIVWMESMNDPRLPYGRIAENARTSTESVSMAEGTEFMARLRSGSVWGPPVNSSID